MGFALLRLTRNSPTQAFWPDLPLDAFGALGLGNQFAMALPGSDTIVVRIGPPAGAQGYEGIFANDLAALVVDSIID